MTHEAEFIPHHDNEETVYTAGELQRMVDAQPDLTAADQAINDLLEETRDEDEIPLLQVHKITDEGEEYCDKWPLDERNLSQIYTYVQTKFGGGKYRIRSWGKKPGAKRSSIRLNKLIKIAVTVDETASDTASDKPMSNDLGPVTEKLMEQSQNQQRQIMDLMRELRQPKQGMDFEKMVTMFTAIGTVVSPVLIAMMQNRPKPKSPIEELAALMQVANGVGIEFNKPEEEETPAWQQGLATLGQMFLAGNQQQQVPGTPQRQTFTQADIETLNQPSQAGDPNNEFTQMAAMLLKCAQEKVPVEDTARTVLQTADQDETGQRAIQLYNLVNQPNAGDVARIIATILPGIMDHAEYVDGVADIVFNTLEERFSQAAEAQASTQGEGEGATIDGEAMQADAGNDENGA